MLSFSGPLNFHCNFPNNALFLKWPLEYMNIIPFLEYQFNFQNVYCLSKLYLYRMYLMYMYIKFIL